MKTITTIIILLIAVNNLLAGDYLTKRMVTVTPTTPGTSIRDFEQPGYKIETMPNKSIMVWPTTPGTTIKDPTLPTYKAVKDANGNTIVYSTTPGTSIRDFNAPSYKIEIKK